MRATPWLLIPLALAVAAGTPNAAAEPGVGEKEILIGSCAPLSGVAKDLGETELAGANAYTDFINATRGGVHGRKIRIRSYDDKYDADEAIACFDRLVKDEVFSAAFIAGGGTALKYTEMAQIHRLPIVGMAAGIKALYEPLKRYVLDVRATYGDETYEETRHLWTDLGVRKIGAIYQNDVLGAESLGGVTRALAEFNAEPIAVASIPRNSLDVDAPLKRLRDSGAEAVFLLVPYAPAAEAVKRAKASGWNPLFLQTPGREAFIPLAGKAAEGTIWATLFPSPDDTRLPAIALFRKVMKKYAPTAPPGIKALEGFIHAMILVEGLERAGDSPTREGLIRAIESMHDVDLGLGPEFRLRFSPENHQGFKQVFFVQVRDGKPVLFSDWKKIRRRLK